MIGAIVACAIFYIGAAIWDVLVMMKMSGPIPGDLWFALALDAGFPLITLVFLVAYVVLQAQGATAIHAPVTLHPGR